MAIFESAFDIGDEVAYMGGLHCVKSITICSSEIIYTVSNKCAEIHGVSESNLSLPPKESFVVLRNHAIIDRVFRSVFGASEWVKSHTSINDKCKIMKLTEIEGE